MSVAESPFWPDSYTPSNDGPLASDVNLPGGGLGQVWAQPNPGLGVVYPVTYNGQTVYTNSPTSGTVGAPTGGNVPPVSSAPVKANNTAARNKSFVDQTLSAWGGDPNDPQIQDIIDRAVAGDWAGTAGGDSLLKGELKSTNWFKTRFAPAIARSVKGLPPISPEEQLGLERSYAQIARQAGLPAGFYDTPDDFAKLITDDVSVGEYQARVVSGYQHVVNAPAEVRQAFNDFYGPGQGDAALAAFFLDDTRAQPLLEKMVQSSDIAGRGAMVGAGISRPLAEQIAGLGLHPLTIDSNFAQLAKQGSTFNNPYYEGTNGITLGNEGVRDQFGLDTAAHQTIVNTVGKREALSHGGGEALLSGQGALGLGTADTGARRK